MPKHLLIAANWKMNPAPAGFDTPDSPYRPRTDVDVVVFPTFLDLEKCIGAGLVTGGQWGDPKPSGAATGDISMAMLKDMGCSSVLCGHSERRKYHHEDNAFVAEQVQAALDVGLMPIACIGETEEERSAGKEKEIVQRQLSALPDGVTVIAYEPVWAIGTGKNATPEQVENMHAFIRTLRPSARLLYGGSLNEKNAQELLALRDVDGALVGGASLKAASFRGIIGVAGDLC
ncbi:MAG: triose-phosphate isomerase [Candidatus Peribacteraceae bacterium]|nr:triose-phosphate isomerase [Candidatus Peribacteraceae bacterium]